MVRAPLSLHELDGREADGTCTDDQHVVAFLWRAAIDRVAADGERFNQGELLERELR